MGKKGALIPGQLADLAILSADYFLIPAEEIKQLESVLTIVGGNIVYAVADYSHLAPPPLPVSPDWSPVKEYGGYARRPAETVALLRAQAPSSMGKKHRHVSVLGELGLWQLSCDCFAF
jgi:hypothetical protein